MRQELLELLLSLDGVSQPRAYHPEGDALTHSLQVFGRALAETHDPVLLAASLLHDVGKAHAGADHDEVGADLLEGLIHPDVVWLVRHHLDLLRHPSRARRKHARHPLGRSLERLRRFDLAGRVPGAHVMAPERALDIVLEDAHLLTPDALSDVHCDARKELL